ncbi:probable methylthioribulose-1-phosphate dehydratase [Aphis gossypii]|uniref:probable methylthioribulose-1-phosphate dehydratase n=1 Tax=Aphis gossypii TaxID=80765 RepID=UPI0021597C9D|nr:probable methylthioribulose-1-phosphate dehydratase [Aphis gossypii]
MVVVKLTSSTPSTRTQRVMANILQCRQLMDNSSKNHPRNLIPELCQKLYYANGSENGWLCGGRGGLSIKYNDYIFVTPSGVQMERLKPDDIFILNLEGEEFIVPSPEKKLIKSQSTTIFISAFNERNAEAVIHVLSVGAVELCMVNPGNEVKITYSKTIKGIFNEQTRQFYKKNEEIIIPIIENAKYEKDLVGTFKMALKNYPSTSAVLVRNHGIYVWGCDWKLAKKQLECYENLFQDEISKRINKFN